MRNPFARWFERRAIGIEPTGGPWFMGGMTQAGVPVTPITALSVPAVFACCQVLSQDVARTPIKLRQQTAPDTYEDAVDHPLYEILHDLSNPETTAFAFKHAMQWQLLLHGCAFAEIVRVDGRVTALWPLESSRMIVDRELTTRRKRWTYAPGWLEGGPRPASGNTFVWLFDPSQPPILELTHPSPIASCREVVGTALALQQYVARFFSNGAAPAGVLQADGRLTPEQKQQLREQWMKLYQGAANAHRTAILDSGLKFASVAMQNDEAQLVEMQKALSTAICGSFRVPPWKTGLMEQTTYSNMSAGELAYVTSTLDPFFECWTEALRRDLLTARQFGQYDITFDRSALARNDLAGLNTALQAGINSGYLSQNDCRKALGLNPIADGDVYRVNTALQPVGVNANVA